MVQIEEDVARAETLVHHDIRVDRSRRSRSFDPGNIYLFPFQTFQSKTGEFITTKGPGIGATRTQPGRRDESDGSEPAKSALPSDHLSFCIGRRITLDADDVVHGHCAQA